MGPLEGHYLLQSSVPVCGGLSENSWQASHFFLCPVLLPPLSFTDLFLINILYAKFISASSGEFNVFSRTRMR